MQKKMSEVHKRLYHYYVCRANSKEVITKHISLMQEKPRSRNQNKAQFYVQNNPISQSLSGKDVAQDRQVFEKTASKNTFNVNFNRRSLVLKPKNNIWKNNLGNESTHKIFSCTRIF